MPYELEFDEKNRYVRATTHGYMEAEALRTFCASATAFVREHNCLKVMVDHRDLTFHLSTMEIFRMHEFAEELGIRRISSIAFVVSPEKSNRDDFTFFEDVFVNRGFRVRIFIDHDDALQWLLPEAID